VWGGTLRHRSLFASVKVPFAHQVAGKDQIEVATSPDRACFHYTSGFLPHQNQLEPQGRVRHARGVESRQPERLTGVICSSLRRAPSKGKREFDNAT